MQKIKEGIMIVKDGKGWGVLYDDGQVTTYGWISMVDAPIYESLTKTTDVTYKGSHYTEELRTGKLVKVRRTTSIEFLEEEITVYQRYPLF